jgi:tetratricopeptide (TPR) repeat protein
MMSNQRSADGHRKSRDVAGRFFEALRCVGAGALISTLGACATGPVKGPEPAPAVASLQEYMQQASKSVAEGSREKARDTYRSAAKAYPASKEPWIKLSEDYFEASDYGNAILAGQEVLLRDSSDAVAASVLAVSGLRVSTSALQTLRTQNRIAGGTRSEAESMTRTLREVLGENVLVPRPESTAVAPPKPRPKPRPPAPAGSKTPDAPAPSTGGSPFDKLR